MSNKGQRRRRSHSFPQIAPGEWVYPRRKGYRMQCCDCGLIHSLDFSLVKDRTGRAKIIFRAFRV